MRRQVLPTALKDRKFQRASVTVPASGETQAHPSGPQFPHLRVPMSAFSNLRATEPSGVLVKGRTSGPSPENLLHGCGQNWESVLKKLSQVTLMGDTPELDNAKGSLVLDQGSAITHLVHHLPVAQTWATQLSSLCLSFPI